MYRGRDRSRFVRMLKPAMGLSLACALATLLVALFRWSLAGLTAQILLTCVGVFLGASFLYIQLRTRSRTGPMLNMLVPVGAAAVAASQLSFLMLVWTGFVTQTFMWRLWWLTMVPSVAITHMVVLQAAGSRRGGPVEALTGVMTVWAGVMVMWLGLRADPLANVSPVYLGVLAFPAICMAAGSLYILVRRVLGVSRPGSVSKGAALFGLIMSHMTAGVVAFYIGQACAENPRRAGDAPNPGELTTRASQNAARQFNEHVYNVQSGVATYMGDTRIINRDPYITAKQVLAIESRLKPGDIILERANWYLSNFGLPDFWKHAALYVGRLADLKRLGIADNPAVVRHMNAYLRADTDGRARTVIEAKSEGVLMTSLTHAMHGDYVAVLRPRVNTNQRATAIVRAFANVGKPYDFNFDFTDNSKLVCTQVVYLSYYDAISMPLKRVLGRTTMPANEIARKYANEAGKPNRQLDFVLFFDAVPSRKIAVESTEQAFRESVNRPSALVENK